MAWSRGASWEEAAASVGASADVLGKWVASVGGVVTGADVDAVTAQDRAVRAVAAGRGPTSRCLSRAEREELAVRWGQGWSRARIAGHLGRHRSTIGRELERGRMVGAPAERRAPLPDGAPKPLGPRPGSARLSASMTAAARRGVEDSRLLYRAGLAQSKADQRARRPKPGKIAACGELAQRVQGGLDLCWSPEQIARALAREYPDRPEMRVSHEAIYQSLYVQGRGGLRRELHTALRTGRAVRRPHAQAQARRSRPRFESMVMISERPPEVDDRAVPGHWEGDLIIGKDGRSAVGTLVERTTRFLMLLHLPEYGRGDTCAHVRDVMTATIATMPASLRQTITWDQGHEMARHVEITAATGVQIYFCDPHSPWQRGSNENTNGLVRQYLPKGTDLSTHSAEELQAIADELNARPRKTLDDHTPSRALADLLSPAQAGVAPTT